MLDETMQKIIRDNWERTRLEKIKRNEQARKQERRENIIALAIICFIIIATVLLLLKLNCNYMNDCINAGHTVNYCERGL